MKPVRLRKGFAPRQAHGKGSCRELVEKLQREGKSRLEAYNCLVKKHSFAEAHASQVLTKWGGAGYATGRKRRRAAGDGETDRALPAASSTATSAKAPGAES